MLRCHGIGINDLLVPNFIGILEVFQVIVRHERCRVVDSPQLTFLTNLNLRSNRVDRRSRTVDVRDRSGGRNGLQVLVVHAVLGYIGGKLNPVFAGRNMMLSKQLTHPFGLRFPFLLNVLGEELTVSVL